MGMFDDKVYLTGDKGVVKEGDVFLLSDAGISGQVKIQGRLVTEAWLDVEIGGETLRVYSSGRAIVNQVERMDGSENLPREVRLGTLEAKRGQNPAFILELVEN